MPDQSDLLCWLKALDTSRIAISAALDGEGNFGKVSELHVPDRAVSEF